MLREAAGNVQYGLRAGSRTYLAVNVKAVKDSTVFVQWLEKQDKSTMEQVVRRSQSEINLY